MHIIKLVKNHKVLTLSLLLIYASASAQETKIEQKVDSVLNLMTLKEKVGQLNQLNAGDLTGPADEKNVDILQEIRNGKIGSLLNVRGAKITKELQQEAMKSRLKIPLIFGQDVIHGYRVIFPIPLAEAASWDMDAIKLSARTAAREASSSGIQWTFAPMVDIARDPRWGRVMEGAGEDPYLGSAIAKARVLGFQGKQIGSLDAVMACAKHFAAYGAAIAGRDYNGVDMSKRQLWEVYLPPFKAALDAGAATFMNSFNTLNGIPATGNSYLQRDILKGAWGFKGFVVSDWGSIKEMVAHGYAKDLKQAAQMAITAGNDMDMESKAYDTYLLGLVKEGKVNIDDINEAVKRILNKKFELGLFKNPYRFSDEKREKLELNSSINKAASREVAKKSIVLLKNATSILPLSKSTKTIALIGPLVKANQDMRGFWALSWGKDDIPVSLYDGVKNKLGNKTNLLYAKGCNINDSLTTGFNEAIETAEKADVVVMAVGETFDMTGEAKSKADIHIPGMQEELVKAIVKTGKPLVVLVMGGRPLIFNYTAENVKSILFTWWLGSQAGDAMADVLFGDYNPSGKLPITFPRSMGQIPIYYAQTNTGRPFEEGKSPNYRSTYLDMSNSPQYAFGHGLSYTNFKYSDLKLDKTNIALNDTIKMILNVTNTGKYAGEEVVQLYIKDKVAQPVRPIMELKDFQKIRLNVGETKQITFYIEKEKLSFYNDDLKWIAQPGDFEVMIGSASDDIRLKENFTLIN
ncbi:glycoside hydrolase family 3 C-terminal domain-containing protein [Pedobacter sp. SD-b]|uniref:beta-glucosidase n=1 Tax=Pedobacter segetis TaxID=2793069 RepID=A0ABS1BM01_9SPHI|nr:glycoside hydrolase family 3 N-terminal domain-containing protein [Pedobacter segetis]MBK0383927.1 glycoside hydrolase family 3 C-terminal domain-containing protein [Pedobacter segetis]